VVTTGKGGLLVNICEESLYCLCVGYYAGWHTILWQFARWPMGGVLSELGCSRLLVIHVTMCGYDDAGESWSMGEGQGWSPDPVKLPVG